ncbi:threonine/serine exporter family protein [Micromonospora yangpuensis]|uniref:Uncharacterized membrane protein YjjP, DUF1212 family n=1 Tax=Micromonospora yangpuensis TaxID=683228 RepID=A0A1C6UYP0_9ACTN|nr:threonine/serine exporter family protein [Micromonospora yangpuensis]GGL94976.1 membrane protein [Micromonospora yangpuensis]SCL58920.1 Uncharacterized membrane protein YjjP, DUF1212 family [Micromonospora yangpuensis]
MARQTGRSGPRATRGTLELALRVGEALLTSGAGSADVVAAMLRIAASYGVSSCTVDVTFTSITVAAAQPGDEPPLSLLKVVQVRATDYTRLDRLHEFAHRLGAARQPLDDAHRELDGILAPPPAYRSWLATAAAAGLAASVAVLLGGGALTAVVAAVASALADRTLRLLTRFGLPSFFQHAAGAAIVSLAPIVLLLFTRHTGVALDAPPSLVVAAGLVVLLAGLSLVGVAQDAINGYLVTASARVLDVLIPTAGIVAGIGTVLDLAQAADVPLRLAAVPGRAVPLWGQALAAAAAAACWALSGHARRRAVLLAAVGGAGAQLTYVAAFRAGLGAATASFVAALVVGMLVTVVTRRLSMAPVVGYACSIVPLLPGVALYRGMFEVVHGTPLGGTQLVQVAMVGLALGAGVTLSEFLITPLLGRQDRWDRWDRRVRRRARGSRY